MLYESEEPKLRKYVKVAIVLIKKPEITGRNQSVHIAGQIPYSVTI